MKTPKSTELVYTDGIVFNTVFDSGTRGPCLTPNRAPKYTLQFFPLLHLTCEGAVNEKSLQSVLIMVIPYCLYVYPTAHMHWASWENSVEHQIFFIGLV